MIKRIILLAILTGGSSMLQAQSAAAPARQQPVPPDFLMSPYFWLFLFLAVILVFAIIIMGRALMRISKSLLPPEQIAAKPVAAYEKTFIGKFIDKLTDTVPIEKEEDILMHHDYDGIHELDNNLPPWWKYGFYLTIIWAFFYLLHYHVFGTGKLQLAEYNEEMRVADEQKKLLAANSINASTAKFLTDADAINSGKDIYTKTCVTCHGPLGGGGAGPNLTDAYWIHGGGIKNVFNTISEGVPAKGMLSWKTQYSPKQIEQISSYVLSLQGTNPPGGKEPQGNLWSEEGTAPSAADSATAAVAPADTTQK